MITRARRLALAAVLLTVGLVGGDPPLPTEADGNEAPGGPAAFRALTGGLTHTCAILGNGSVRCWGANLSGQLGLGDTASRGDGPGEMGTSLPAVSLGTGRTATALTAGDFHTCALLDNATVKCWGMGALGRLGVGGIGSNIGDGPNEMGDNLPAVDLGAGRTATALTSGGAHTCALLDNATVKCWGANASGQLGLGDTNNRGDGANEMGDNLPAISLGAGRTATAVTAGGLHTCAVLDNASVKCWGENAAGQLGLGDTNNRGDAAGEMGDSLPTVNMGTSRTATTLSAGGTSFGAGHTCAILDNALLKCWGANGSGQLGVGDTDNRGDGSGEMGQNLSAVPLGLFRTAVSVSAAGSHTCARLDNARVKCWGGNGSGQLGLGDNSNRGDAAGEMGDTLSPVDLGAGRTATAVTTGGGGTSCAALDTGTRKCWGGNANGELGQGDVSSRGDSANELGDQLPAIALAPPGLSGTITDTVTGAPIPGALIAVLRTSDFGAATSMVADGSGNYSAAVPAGSYFFYVIDLSGAHTTGFSGPPTTYTVTGTAILDADATMVPTRGAISGTVTDQTSGQPVAGVWAIAINTSGAIAGGAITAASGTYAISGLPAGNYKVTFFDGAGGRVQEYWDNSPDFTGGSLIAVGGGTTATGRNAALAFP